ncbi:MAG: hypothetical protein EXS15_08175 [Phycisphaerales bacterium]|nr:hypothetical protein [Phycisphaerales bacterium]
MSLVIALPKRLRRRLEREVGASVLTCASDAAFGLPGVSWLPLELAREPIPPTSDDDSEEELLAAGIGDGSSDDLWRRRFRHMITLPQGKLVFVLEIEKPGRFAEVIGDVKKLVETAERALQEDRILPPIGAIIVIAHEGLDESDAELLEKCAFGVSNESDHGLHVLASSKGRPCYLMNQITRATVGGRIGSVSKCWPSEVTRLLASIASDAPRENGLHAWRSISFNPTRFQFEDIQTQALRLMRVAMQSADGESNCDTASAGKVGLLEAPKVKIASDGVPQHCMDIPSGRNTRPELPSWLKLDPEKSSNTGVHHANWRTDTAGGRDSLNKSDWYRRFEGRGKRFMEDRMAKALEALEAIEGPRSVQATAWQRIHDMPEALRWFAYGSFYKAHESELRDLDTAMLGWMKLGERESSVRDGRANAVACGEELDLARAHFLAIWPRIACALAASLFVGVSYGLAMKSVGWGWSIWIGLVAPIGAFVGAAILLWLEVRGGQTARNDVEEQVYGVETEIASLFGERVRRGARSDLLARRVQWLQSASKTQEAAERLLRITQLAETRSIARLEKVAGEAEVIAWDRATRIECSDAVGIDSFVDELLRRDHTAAARRRSEYRRWWSEELFREDRDCTGAIRLWEFEPRLRGKLGEMVDECRASILGQLGGSVAAAHDHALTSAAIMGVFGVPSDFAGLGCTTRRAFGRPITRVVRVHCCLPGHLSDSVTAVAEYYGGTVRAIASFERLDCWGLVGLLLEEIPISLRNPKERKYERGLNGTVSVWEGFLDLHSSEMMQSPLLEGAQRE